MKNSPYLIFDFDGTMVDSFNAVIQKFNLLTVETRDIEVAKAPNINSIAVTLGFNSEAVSVTTPS